MTTLEYFYKNKINSLLNIDLQPTNTEHVFAADCLTFNLLTQEACIDYDTIYNFYFDYTTLYLGYVSADTMKTYKNKYLDIELTVYPKHKFYVDNSIIDEDKVSRISWQSNFTNLGNLLIGEVNYILNTNFTKIENVYKDEETQFVIDAGQMLIMMYNEQYSFSLDEHYMYIYNASKHYKKFLKYSTAYKQTGLTLVLAKVHESAEPTSITGGKR